MNVEWHKNINHQKQVKYARYLSNLTSSRRINLLQNMKPQLREKMEALIIDHKAKEVANMEPQVRAMYLKNLKKWNPNRYEAMLTKVMAHMWTDHQNPLLIESKIIGLTAENVYQKSKEENENAERRAN